MEVIIPTAATADPRHKAANDRFNTPRPTCHAMTIVEMRGL